MFNFEIWLLSILVILIFFIVILYVQKKNIERNLQIIRNENFKLKESIENNKTVDFKYASEAMNFLDKIIVEKYKFYMFSTLMPLYLDKQVPEKKIINEIKEKIYVSVVGGLTLETKKSILKFFTEKGIEMYTHEKILVLMNETDIRTSDKLNENFKDKDIRGNRLNVLIP